MGTRKKNMGFWALARGCHNRVFRPTDGFCADKIHEKTGRWLIVKYLLQIHNSSCCVRSWFAKNHIVCRSIFVEGKLYGMHLRHVGIVSHSFPTKSLSSQARHKTLAAC